MLNFPAVINRNRPGRDETLAQSTLGTGENKRQPFSKQDESHIAASKESASCQASLSSTLTVVRSC